MEKYNYYVVMETDIQEWLYSNSDEIEDMDINDAAEHLNDILWADDEITGNGGGWYDNEHNCQEYICHNLDLLFEALYEFGEFETSLLDSIHKNVKNGTLACWADTTIRCYLLNECVWNVLERWYKKNARPQKN